MSKFRTVSLFLMKSLEEEGKKNKRIVVGFGFCWFFTQLEKNSWKQTGPIGDQIYEGYPHVLT